MVLVEVMSEFDGLLAIHDRKPKARSRGASSSPKSPEGEGFLPGMRRLREV
jgi:hypothetical protein